jgi:UDP-N-acetylglucosamine acyltransferase
LTSEEAFKRIAEECEPLPEILHFISFCRASKRGLMGLQGVSSPEEDMSTFEEEEEKEFAALK